VNRTPELIFAAEKINEAVPRPCASDGERKSRGRFTAQAQKNTLQRPVAEFTFGSESARKA